LDSAEWNTLALEGLSHKAVILGGSARGIGQVGIELEDGADIGGRCGFSAVTVWSLLFVFYVFGHFLARFPERGSFYLPGR
jgi:hypothetical protein